MRKLQSLTIFFPFFNDAGTVSAAISDAYKYGRGVANNLEVIAIHGGASTDNTFEKIKNEKKKHPDLIIINKTNNTERYAVIKYGFYKATKEWIFYTDGDLQYSLKELYKLIKKQWESDADAVNGYRQQRSDNLIRVWGGGIYRLIVKVLFKLPIDDLECDFRLIRATFIKKIRLQSRNASILLELIKKLESLGAKFAQVAVHHYPRSYGKETYSSFSLLKEKIPGDIKVWKLLKSVYNKKT